MKILLFPRYHRNGASSRLRLYQYIPYWEQSGYSVKVAPFFSEEYLTNLYSGKKLYVNIIASYFKRFFNLFTVFKYDIIIIEKELFPGLPAFAEKILQLFGKKTIVDYDDAIFSDYELSKNWYFNRILKNKIYKVMKYSSLVIVCNSYLAEKAIKSGAKKVEIIPTVVDLNRYSQKVHTSKNQLVIGWIGTPTTFKYIVHIQEIINNLIENNKVIFHFVGVEYSGIFSKNVQYFNWSETDEVNQILQFDIGVMPLIDNAWEQGKCAYKLIQYLACGIPVIASPVGMNCQVVQPLINGFLANDQNEWLAAVEHLKNVENRNLMGQNARRLVEEKYSLQVQNNFLLQSISNILT